MATVCVFNIFTPPSYLYYITFLFKSQSKICSLLCNTKILLLMNNII
nr:MAG TPA: hypothetical protein [Caudoviricetes sp.]